MAILIRRSQHREDHLTPHERLFTAPVVTPNGSALYPSRHGARSGCSSIWAAGPTTAPLRHVDHLVRRDDTQNARKDGRVAASPRGGALALPSGRHRSPARASVSKCCRAGDPGPPGKAAADVLGQSTRDDVGTSSRASGATK
jgi:hypothetical protein